MNWPYNALLQRLMLLEGFNDFFVQYSSVEHDGKPIEDIITSYKAYRLSNGMPISEEENRFIDVIKDRLLEISYRENKNLLFFVAKSLGNDGDEVIKFREIWNNAKTGRYSAKLRDRQSYKTIQEFFLLNEYKDNDIIASYRNSHHPLISQIIGSSFINAGYYSKGIPLLLQGVLYSNNPNNPYWHSMYGMFGCTWSLWEMIRLYGLSKFKQNYDNHYKNLIKLLYLYLSRSIAICEINTAAQGHDFYRNRADFQRDNYSIMMAIFAESEFLFTNMDIQYMSDCHMAFMLCSKCGVPGLAEQAYWDSLKMYRYSSLNYFNEDNGLREIEDATFFELVERGRIRANIVAENILEQYIVGRIRIPDYIFEEMFVEIMNRIPDSPEKIEWHE